MQSSTRFRFYLLLHSGSFGHLLLLIRTKAWVQSLFGLFGFHGESFWSGATEQSLNLGQFSWKHIRERLYMTQCISSAGKQLKRELGILVLVVVEWTRHMGKNGPLSWPTWLGPLCSPASGSENTLSSGSPPRLLPGMSSGWVPNPLCWVYLSLATFNLMTWCFDPFLVPQSRVGYTSPSFIHSVMYSAISLVSPMPQEAMPQQMKQTQLI